MSIAPRPEILVRRAGPDDEPAILELLAASLGWSTDERHRSLFRWKHQTNPFGPSPAWVAVASGEVVGFRTFLRWEFERPSGVAKVVRAIDTAVHPEHQRQGLFSRMLSAALTELTAEGAQFVFNTPNERSRPGYLKLAWQVVGRLPVATRVVSIGALGRLARSRVPAERWSEPTSTGLSAKEALADDAAVAALLDSQPPPDGLRTRRTASYLRWRYGGGPAQYRAVLAGRTAEDGLAFFRARRRGPSLEIALCDVLAPGGNRHTCDALTAKAAKVPGADAVVQIGRARPTRGFLPLPGQGPVLVWRALTDSQPTPLEDWHLSLGDVELF